MSLLIFGIVCATLIAIGGVIVEKSCADKLEPLGTALFWAGVLGLAATLTAWFTLILVDLGLISL